MIFKTDFPFIVFPLCLIGLETQNCHVHLCKVEWKNKDKNEKNHNMQMITMMRQTLI